MSHIITYTLAHTHTNTHTFIYIYKYFFIFIIYNDCRPKSYQWCAVSADVWEVGMPCRSFFLGGGLHRLQLVGCPKYPIFFPFDMFSYALRQTCWEDVLGHKHREGFGCNGQLCSAFPSACGDTLCKISVIDTSVLKPGACARLADDFAKQHRHNLLQYLSGQQFGGSCGHTTKRATQARNQLVILWQSRLAYRFCDALQVRFQNTCFTFSCAKMMRTL